MAKNKNEAAPSQEPDADLTAGAPVDLPGDDAGETQLALRREPMSLLADPDECGLPMDGVRPPFLQLAHTSSSSLDMEKFTAGDLVLAKDFLACPKGGKLDVIILNYERYLKEYLSQAEKDEGRIERHFKTVAEAVAAGLNMEWGPKGSGIKPDASVAFDMILLIRKPDGAESGLYGVNIGIDDAEGKPTEWAICRTSLDKINGTLMKNTLTIPVNTKLRGIGIWAAMWEWQTGIYETSKYKPFVIRSRFKCLLDPLVRDNIRGVLAVPVSAKDGDEGEEFP